MNPPLKWHGGKHYLAKRIVSLMPEHLHYVEPYAGGLSVLLARDPEGVSEVVNDLDGRLTNFWRVLRAPHTFEAFHRVVQATPFSDVEYRTAAGLLRDLGWAGVAPEGDIPESSTAAHVLRAAAFFIRCRQSLAGRGKDFAPLSRTRTRRGMNEQASAWLTAVEGLPAVHARLKRVVVLNRDALDVIRQQDGPETLFYLDPPYLDSTRASPDVYRHEMTREQHKDLVEALSKLKGKFLLSGYDNTLYSACERHLGWRRVDFDLPNNAAGGAEKRRMTESVWCNYPEVA